MIKTKNQDNTWEYILDIFIQDFERDKYNKDQKLPTENETAAEYGVSRNEIRIVYKKLKEMGYIYSLQGCGSFFTGKQPKIPLSMTKPLNFSRKMEEMRLDYRTENIESCTIDYIPDIYESMHAKDDDIIWKVVLLRFVNNRPVAIHTNYINQRYFPHLPKNASLIQSSHDYLYSNGYQDIRNAESKLSLSPISQKKRTLLDMQYKQEALVMTGKTLCSSDQKILQLFCNTYNPDAFQLTFDN